MRILRKKYHKRGYNNIYESHIKLDNIYKNTVDWQYLVINNSIVSTNCNNCLYIWHLLKYTGCIIPVLSWVSNEFWDTTVRKVYIHSRTVNIKIIIIGVRWNKVGLASKVPNSQCPIIQIHLHVNREDNSIRHRHLMRSIHWFGYSKAATLLSYFFQLAFNSKFMMWISSYRLDS